jgi:phosphohistidine phosphatase SixA
MSKTIVFMRHGLADRYDRLIVNGGDKQVENAAHEMIAAGIRPDVIYCSLARRTRQSAKILAEKFRLAGIEVSIKEDKRLEFGPIIDVIAEMDNEKVHTVIMVSHQEAIWPAYEKLTLKSFIPHSGEAAVIDCPDRSWKEIAGSFRNKIGRIFRPGLN